MSLGRHVHSSSLLLSLLVISITAAPSSAQAPAQAPSPAAVKALPPSPPSPLPPSPSKTRKHDIIQILEKEGDFTVLLRLMRSTHVADQINSQLEDLNDGLTVFAPTDDAFSELKPGALNTMSDEQQVELMQFHVVPTLLSMTQFQTVSNPLMTKAGGNKPGEFPLNVTSNGDRVSLYSDSTEASVERTIFADNRLAVYQVNKVLLAKRIFPKTVAAIAPTQPKQQEEPTSEVTTSASGGLFTVKKYALVAVAVGTYAAARVFS